MKTKKYCSTYKALFYNNVLSVNSPACPGYYLVDIYAS